MWILLFVNYSDKRQWGGEGTGKSKIKTDGLRFWGY